MGRRKGGRECCIDKLEETNTTSLLYIYYAPPPLLPFSLICYILPCHSPSFVLASLFSFFFPSHLKKNYTIIKYLLLDMCIAELTCQIERLFADLCATLNSHDETAVWGPS